ncbi:hypothetical protein GCM10017786_00170 [Amycolatopsis deserti]|uniref:Transporter n=1 Tax=Amycolatopsis deserti TaxID=185696 RepID=A0ABQ3IA37_9PSEU|nr:transporter [Amycolatopsis deserti]GHE75456.1 hypothetical protein GCM10017786_00170 [Amycolatopsis deserti]
MKDLLFMLADLWMIFAGFFFGWKFIRRFGNYLLGLEWMVVATSGSNFLLWALLGGHEDSVLYDIAYFFDAFSRSVGITLILVMGLMRVTHRYKPSVAVDVGVFALAAVAGLYLQQFRPPVFHAGPATFYVVVNALTTLFLAYFTWRVWKAGAAGHAFALGLVSLAGSAIAIIYDFFPLAGDDAHRTIFYTAALATWGTQMCVCYLAYRALHVRTVATGVEPAAHAARA